MATNWQKIAMALSSRLQFEVACGRGAMISEDISKTFLAEAIQSQIPGSLEPEFNHPDIPGNSRLDLLIRSSTAQNIEAAIEHKWVRYTGDKTSRQWMAEILGDLFRVEKLSSQMAQGSERILVVSGEVKEMRRKVWESESHRGEGRPRIKVVNTLMQSRPQSGAVQEQATTIQLRDVGRPFLSKIRHSSRTLLNDLPTRYAIRLVGFHRADADGVECAIWKITRPAGQRSTFDGSIQWEST